MFVQREKAKVQGHICNARIWFEDGKQSQEASDDEYWLGMKPKCQGADVTHKMQPEDSDEKVSKGIENFDEEVPPKTNVGRQVGDSDLCSVAR